MGMQRVVVAAVGGSAVFAFVAGAQTWVEVGDAGELPSTAQEITGTGPLAAISGRNGGDDTDMFLLQIVDPAAFRATTVDLVDWDTQLWLFRPDGMGVVLDDDEEAGETAQSTLTNRFVMSPGPYLLAISEFDRDPFDAGSQLLWENEPFRRERRPDGPGAANPIAAWDGKTQGGHRYTIALSGCAFIGACYADCDTSTGKGVLDVLDFECFRSRYATGLGYACDCDTTTGRGVCDLFDFLCFQNAFAQGCP
jgi:hypothetical protein